MPLEFCIGDFRQSLELFGGIRDIDIEKAWIRCQVDADHRCDAELIDHRIRIQIDHLQAEVGIAIKRDLHAAPHAPTERGENRDDTGELGEAAKKSEEAEPCDARGHHADLQHILSRVAAACGAFVFHGGGAGGFQSMGYDLNASESSAMRAQRSPKEMPIAAAALGSRLVSVMPGMVLASSTNGRWFASSRTSTRE